MRFIIGIVPPPAIKEQVSRFQKGFPSNKVPFFNEPHITLKAPNGLTEDKAWLADVTALVEDHPRFQIKLDGINGFEDRVLFLDPVFSQDLMDLHLKLVGLLSPDTETKGENKFFEGSIYQPHLTLGETTWGGMTTEELEEMRERAETEFLNIPPFDVDFVRVYQKDKDGEPYHKLLDIPLKA